MTTNEDQNFDRNLKAAGSKIPVPEAPFHEVVDRCAETLTASARHARGRRTGWLATLAVAASIALAFGLLTGPFETGTKVQAATILAKLNEQIAAPTMIELTLDSIALKGVEVDGFLQLSTTGVAGDLHVIADKNDMSIEVDLALGISKEEGWILLRKINIADPQISAMLAMFFPAGTETLLTLPPDMFGDDFAMGSDGFQEVLEALSVENLVQAFQSMIEKQPGTGATIVEQNDGTVVLTVPIADAKSLEGLIRIAAKAIEGTEIDDDDISIDDDDGAVLFGTTLEIVYDPAAELVRAFSISNFGDKQGTLSIAIGGDSLDLDLLDSSRVTGPNTRTFDMSALMSMVERFGK